MIYKVRTQIIWLNTKHKFYTLPWSHGTFYQNSSQCMYGSLKFDVIHERTISTELCFVDNAFKLEYLC